MVKNPVKEGNDNRPADRAFWTYVLRDYMVVKFGCSPNNAGKNLLTYQPGPGVNILYVP